MLRLRYSIGDNDGKIHFLSIKTSRPQDTTRRGDGRCSGNSDFDVVEFSIAKGEEMMFSLGCTLRFGVGAPLRGESGIGCIEGA